MFFTDSRAIVLLVALNAPMHASAAEEKCTGAWKYFNLPATQNVSAFAAVPDGRLFVGLSTGTTRFGYYGIDEAAGTSSYVWHPIAASAGGLPSNKVTDVVTVGGELWVGTQDAGIGILDLVTGAWRTHSTANSSLPSNFIYRITPIESGLRAKVWLATGGGAVHYERRPAIGGTLVIWGILNQIVGLPAQAQDVAVYTARGITKTFITDGTALYNWDGIRVSPIGSTGNCQIVSATRIALDRTSAWFGGLDPVADHLVPGGPCAYYQGRFGASWSDYPQLTDLYSRRINDMSMDHAGRMWFAATGRAAVHDLGTWCIFDPAVDPLDGDVVMAVEGVGEGVWLGYTGKNRITYFSPDWRSYVNTDVGAGAADQFQAILIEDEAVWLGLKWGLARLSGGNWDLWNLPLIGGTSSLVKSIGRDGEGTLWIGTTNHGLFEFDGATFVNHQGNGRPASDITSFATDSQGRFWVGTRSGLSLRASGYWLTFDQTNSPLSGDPISRVFSLAVDGADRLWIGTNGGLDVLEPETGVWSHETAVDAFFTGIGGVRKVEFAPNGDLWAVAEGGAARRNSTGAWTLFDASSGALPHDDAWSLSVDPVGRVWVGTRGGLALLENGSWRHFHATGTPLSHDFVGVLASSAEETWIAQGGKVSIRNPADEPIGHQPPRIDSFSPTSGAPGTIVTILGANFDTRALGLNVVRFGLIRAGGSNTPAVPAEVLSGTANQLRVRVPGSATSGKIRVRSHRLETSSAAEFTVGPAIERLERSCLGFGDRLIIYGFGFRGADDRIPEIRVGSGAWRIPEHTEPNKIRDRVRDGDTEGTVRVRLANGTSAASPEPLALGSLRITGHKIQQGVNYDRDLVWGKRTLVHVDVAAQDCDTHVTDGRLFWKKKNGQRVAGSYAFLAGADGVSVQLSGGDGSVIDEDTGVDFVASFDTLMVGEFSGPFPLAEFDGVAIILKNGPVEVATHTIPASAFKYFDFGTPIKFALMAVLPDDGIPGTQWDVFWQQAWASMAHVARIFPQRENGWRSALYQWIAARSSYIKTGMLDLDDDDRFCEVKDEVDGILDPSDNEIGIALVDSALQAPGSPGGRAPQEGEAGYTGVVFNAAGKAGRVTAHEGGHILGLVDEDASNHDGGNKGHSKYDEGDGACDPNLTFGATQRDQLGRTGRVVSLLPNGGFLDLSDPGCGMTRAKSLMSYAPGRDDTNVFYEPFDYKKVYDLVKYFELSGPASPGGGGVDGRFLRLRGSVTETGEVNMTVSYVEPTGVPSRPAPEGPYRLRILGSDGAALHEHPFALSFKTGEGPSTIARLVLRVPFPDGAKRVELLKNGQVLWARSVSARPPAVQVVSPANGQAFGPKQNVPIRWTASDPDGSDPDGDALQFALESSTDGVTWERLSQYVIGTAWDWPTGARPASNNMRVRVRASDGFNTSTAVSAPFVVQPSPPIAIILSPEEGSKFTEGMTIDVSGDAMVSSGPDAGRFTWFLNNKVIEAANDRTVRVVPDGIGPQVIRLVVNDGNLAGSAEVTVEVIADYDRDGMPNEWELAFGLSPLDPDNTRDDPDGDLLANLTECRIGTDPINPDSDGDGFADGDELAAGSSPSDPGSVPPAGPVLNVGTRSIGFSWRTDEVDLFPPEPVLTWVTNLGPGTIQWTAASTAAWLTVDPANGTTPEPIEIVPDHEDLGPGVHTARVVVTAPGVPNSPWTIDVTVEVQGKPVDPQGTFSRGDANSDRVLDLSDVIFTLAWLFTGGKAPECAKAADADDNGAVEITDPIVILDYLFRGGRRPDAPFGACGQDPTADALECGRFPPCE